MTAPVRVELDLDLARRRVIHRAAGIWLGITLVLVGAQLYVGPRDVAFLGSLAAALALGVGVVTALQLRRWDTAQSPVPVLEGLREDAYRDLRGFARWGAEPPPHLHAEARAVAQDVLSRGTRPRIWLLGPAALLAQQVATSDGRPRVVLVTAAAVFAGCLGLGELVRHRQARWLARADDTAAEPEPA